MERSVRELGLMKSTTVEKLADLLVESLDSDELGRIEQMWLSEAKRRRDEVRAGNVKTIPGPEGLRRVRDRLNS